MFLIGLTGGIATGKSTVTKYMKELGVPVVDADVISREVVKPGTNAYYEIRDYFGDSVFNPLTGELDRGKLGALVFTDIDKRKKINSITHPAIYAQMRREVWNYFIKGEQMVVLDLPLLFEKGSALQFIYKTIVVNCEKKEQYKRLMSRGGYDEQQAEDRISCQMPLSMKIDRADFVVDNTSSRDYTKEQVVAIVKNLRQSRRHIRNRVLIFVGCFLLLGFIYVGFFMILGYVNRNSIDSHRNEL